MATSDTKPPINWRRMNSQEIVLPGMKFEGSLSQEIQKPTDFRIEVEDQAIDVHKKVLLVASDYFCMMLESGMKESNNSVMRIQDCTIHVVKTIIAYFYGKELCIEWKHVKDYLDIVELWQLTRVKHLLEIFLTHTVEISFLNCIEWFYYADVYHMENVLLRTKELINSQAVDVSRTEDFEPLSQSQLISVVSHKDIKHTAVLIRCCIKHTLVNKSSQEDFCVLMRHIRFKECNPAYLKHILDAYSTTLLTDQVIRAEIEEITASSFIVITGSDHISITKRDVLAVNLRSHTILEIGTLDELGYCAPAGATEFDIFYCSSLRCALFDLVHFKTIHLPSLPSGNLLRAVVIGTKIFAIIWLGDRYATYCLDVQNLKDMPNSDYLNDSKNAHDFDCLHDSEDLHDLKDLQDSKNLQDSSDLHNSGDLQDSKDLQGLANLYWDWTIFHDRQKAILPLHYRNIVCVDSLQFVFTVPPNSHSRTYSKLLCYDTEKKTWSSRADPPVQTHDLPRAVVINKDIYYIGGYDQLSLRYSTTDDKWTNIQWPPGGGYDPPLGIYPKLTSVKGKLVVFDRQNTIFMYDGTKWERSQVMLPSKLKIEFACTTFASTYN